MKSNSNLKDIENVMAANAESSTVNAQSSATNVQQNAEARIAFYAARFAEYSDDKLEQTVESERKVHGWGSERSYFLAALRGECEKRGIAFCWK